MKLLFLIVLVLAGLTPSCRTPSPAILAPGMIEPCGQKPNCVSAADSRPQFAVPLLDLKRLTPSEACGRFGGLLQKQQRVQIVRLDKHYIHAEFRSATFGFVDDVEILCTERGILLRSQSRTGGFDWGVNRRRIESLRMSWQNES